MLNKLIRAIGGDPSRRTIDQYAQIVKEINALEADFEPMTDAQLRSKTDEFRQRLAEGEDLDDLLPEAFALVREASKRTLGLRHYDVQLIGGVALHKGIIAEMRTGEGKTLVATLPLYLNALTGRGVHLVTVNDYLARRDARWNAPIYNLLGLNVGVLQMAARTENGKKAFLVDLERESPHEDQHHLRMVPRQEAYAADIVYGTNSEFGFDYLRDNMTMRLDDRVQRGHHYAIVDEVDNVLIDEARTPLIISGPASESTEWYARMAQVARQLRTEEDVEINEKDKAVTLTEMGEAHVEDLLGMPLRDPERPEDVTPEQARLIGYLEQALRAQYLYRRNKDYLVQGGKVVIVDEFTGRQMPGRRWSDGLHQAVEAKEGVRVQAENVTYATVTIQNYFRMYKKLAGMSGTALTEAEEFNKIYKLEVLAIPTNLEFQAYGSNSPLVELEARDEQGYKYKYYARRGDTSKSSIYWRRKDYPDVVYRTEEAKFRAITKEILRYNALGRPMLVGTTSVELSERLSKRLRAEPLRRLAQVLVIRKAWFDKHGGADDVRISPELKPLNTPLDDLQIADLRKMARDLEISFNPLDDQNLPRLRQALELPPEAEERLKACLEGGIPHNVLNAREHTEESRIIAGAGAFGAVTIATNMAGRGVDIRLGGELGDDTIKNVSLLLRRKDIAQRLEQNDLPGIDEMPVEQWPQALALVDPSELRSRSAAVEDFLRFVDAEKKVRLLGGLHVIGSERHEARRIDNQLRGRSARQGDPGSSRFYLSMEDELMRLFGGQQADNLMQRMSFDDDIPLEFGVVARLIEQSQTRVEGANFDVRKHLLEYDDVMNSQRQRIYGQRDLIFTKDDLSEDVTDMLRTEVKRRVPEALKDQEGPWRLLAWLEQVQPSIDLGPTFFPSYPLRLILERIRGRKSTLADTKDFQEVVVSIAREALQAEKDHLLLTIDNLLEAAHNRLETQIKESREAVETFFEGIDLEGNGEGEAPRSPRELMDELASLVHVPVRLSLDQQRALRSEPRQVSHEIRDQVEEALRQQAVTRLLGGIERRIEDSLQLSVSQLAQEDWDRIEDLVKESIQSVLDNRIERLVGRNGSAGQIGREVENALARVDGAPRQEHLVNLLVGLPQGSRATFDKKTHRRMLQATTRLTYIYLAARQLEDLRPEAIANEVLEHLEEAQSAIRRAWGSSAWPAISQARWQDLDAFLQARLEEVIGPEKANRLMDHPLQILDSEDIASVKDELGRRALTGIYRQLLLGVITDLWVDYLTQMEALRVSIGLEAYAQRDPLVQYKSRASEQFQELLSNMRLGVVSRMFTYRPRELPIQQFGLKRTPAAVETGSGSGKEATVPTLPELTESEEPEPASSQVPEEGTSEELESQTARKVVPSQLSKSQRRRLRRR